jgi:hypothetical protein
MIQGIATVMPRMKIYDVSNYYTPRNMKKFVDAIGEGGETKLTYYSSPENYLGKIQSLVKGPGALRYIHNVL